MLIFNKPPGLRWVSVSLPGAFYGTLLQEGTHEEMRQNLIAYWRDHKHWDVSSIKPEAILIEELPEMFVPRSAIEDAKVD